MDASILNVYAEQTFGKPTAYSGHYIFAHTRGLAMPVGVHIPDVVAGRRTRRIMKMMMMTLYFWGRSGISMFLSFSLRWSKLIGKWPKRQRG